MKELEKILRELQMVEILMWEPLTMRPLMPQAMVLEMMMELY